MDNEYEDAVCPMCDHRTIEANGFCEECFFDYEGHLIETEKEWDVPKNWTSALANHARKENERKNTRKDSGD